MGTLASTAGGVGLAGLAGTGATVGVGGYVLGGGLGWLGRRHGLASASLIAVDYVDAAGEQRHAGEADDPEALWAFRGGGGVGIVTRLRLRLWPTPRSMRDPFVADGAPARGRRALDQRGRLVPGGGHVDGLGGQCPRPPRADPSRCAAVP